MQTKIKQNCVFINNFNRVIDPVSKQVNNKAKKSRDHYYKTGDFINYISRPDAVFNLDITDDEVKILNALRTGNKSQKEKYNKIVEAMNLNFKNTGLYGKNGLMRVEEAKNLKQQMKTLEDEQILWNTIISFDNNFIKETELYTSEKIQKALEQEIKKLFKNNNLDESNMTWFWSMHTNTDNNHIHLGFFENKKSQLAYLYDKNGNKIKDKNGNYKMKSEWKKSGSLKGCESFKAGLEFNILQQQKDNSVFLNSQHQLRHKFKIGIDSLDNIFEELDFDEKKVSWKEAKQIFADINKAKINLIEKIDLFSDQLKSRMILKYGSLKKIPIKKISYGWKEMTEFERKQLEEITMNFINASPEIKKEYDIFIEENNRKAAEFGQVYANYELSNLEVEDRELTLTTADLLKTEDEWKKEMKNSKVAKLKYEKLKYRNTHIKSLNAKGDYQGIIPEFSNKILKKIVKKWKDDEWKKEKGLNTKISEKFTPKSYSKNKKHITQILMMPNSLLRLVQNEKRKAQKLAKEINYNIEKEKQKILRKEMKSYGYD